MTELAPHKHQGPGPEDREDFLLPVRRVARQEERPHSDSAARRGVWQRGGSCHAPQRRLPEPSLPQNGRVGRRESSAEPLPGFSGEIRVCCLERGAGKIHRRHHHFGSRARAPMRTSLSNSVGCLGRRAKSSSTVRGSTSRGEAPTPSSWQVCRKLDRSFSRSKLGTTAPVRECSVATTPIGTSIRSEP